MDDPDVGSSPTVSYPVGQDIKGLFDGGNDMNKRQKKKREKFLANYEG